MSKELIDIEIAIKKKELAVVKQKQQIEDLISEYKKKLKPLKKKLETKKKELRRAKCDLYDFNYRQTEKGIAAKNRILKRYHEKRNEVKVLC